MKLSLKACLLETRPSRLSGLSYGGDSLASRRGWDTYDSSGKRAEHARFKQGTDRYIVDPQWGRLLFIELDGMKFKDHKEAMGYLAKQGFDEDDAKTMLSKLPTDYSQ